MGLGKLHWELFSDKRRHEVARILGGKTRTLDYLLPLTNGVRGTVIIIVQQVHYLRVIPEEHSQPTGIDHKKAMAWALGVESMTIVGGLIGFYLVNSTSMFWLGILYAHVGGGFFDMIASAVRGVLGQHTEEPRYVQHAMVSGSSFISSAVLLGLVAR